MNLFLASQVLVIGYDRIKAIVDVMKSVRRGSGYQPHHTVCSVWKYTIEAVKLTLNNNTDETKSMIWPETKMNDTCTYI